MVNAGEIALKLLVESDHAPALFLQNPKHDTAQLFRIDRLQKIIGNPHAQRLLSIAKLRKASQNEPARMGRKRPRPSYSLQSIQLWHFDINEDQMRHAALDHLDHLLAIGCILLQ